MKIAICFCGQIRTGLLALPNIKRFIGNLWDNCDFFIHTWNYENSKFLARDTLKGKKIIRPESRHVTNEEILNFSNLLNTKKIIIEDYEKFANDRPNTIPNIVWYTSERVLDIRRQYEIETQTKYDVVIKMRPDIIYPPSRSLEHEIKYFQKNTDKLYSDLLAPWRLDDVFWVMSSATADKLQGLTTQIDLAQTNNPCDVVLKFCKQNKIKLANTNTRFLPYAVFRVQSKDRNSLTDFKEIFRDDIYYYSQGVTEEELDLRFELEDKNKVNYD